MARRRILCLDWDRRSLRLIVARVGSGTVKLEDAHQHKLPPSLNADDPAAMGEFIAGTLKRHRMKFRRCVVDVPRDRAVINRLTIPPTPPQELAGAVQFQAMRELPFSLDEAVIDHVIMQRDENRNIVEVLLAAVRKDVLGRISATCEAAGLTPERIGLRPYANLVAIQRMEEFARQRILFVELGPSMTEIDVFRDGQLAFSRAASVTVPVRGYDAWASDSRVMGIHELETIEAQHDETSVAELVLEVVRSLQAYRVAEPNAVIDQIVIAGGSGLEPELMEAVEKRLGLPCALYDPTSSLSVSPTESLKLRSFSATLGLAWGVSRENLLESNFLDPKKPLPPGITLRRRLQFAGVAAAALVVCVAGGTAYHLYQQSSLLEKRHKEIEQLSEMVKADIELRNHIDELDDWNRQAVWVDHWATVVESMVDPGRKMIAKNIKFEESSSSITLDVLCKDYETYTGFIEKLRTMKDAKEKPVYTVNLQGKWQEGMTGDADLIGSARVQIVVNDVLTFRAEAKKRETARKNKLLNF